MHDHDRSTCHHGHLTGQQAPADITIDTAGLVPTRNQSAAATGRSPRYRVIIFDVDRTRAEYVAQHAPPHVTLTIVTTADAALALLGAGAVDVLIAEQHLPTAPHLAQAPQSLADYLLLPSLKEVPTPHPVILIVYTCAISVRQKIWACQLGAAEILVEPISTEAFWLRVDAAWRIAQLGNADATMDTPSSTGKV